VIKQGTILVFLFCTMLSFSNIENDSIRIVASVNGEPIVQNELKMNELRNKSSDSDSSLLNAKILETAIQIKLQQQLAQKLGLVKDISYSGFQHDFRSENSRRSLAIRNNVLFYGPMQFTEENYYQYQFSKLLIEIKKRLAESEFVLSDEKLKTYYEAVKDSLYKLPDYLKVQRFDIFFNDKKLAPTQQTRIIGEIQSRLRSKGVKSDDIQIVFKNIVEIKSQVQIFDPTESQNREGEERAEVLKLIGNIQPGQFCSISTASDSCCFYQILQRKALGYRTFESVKNSLKSSYIDYLYKKYLAALRENAIIERY